MKISDKKQRDRTLFLKPLLSIIVLAALSIGAFLMAYQHWMNSLFEHVEAHQRQNLRQIVSIARNAVEPILTDARSGKLTREEALTRIRALVRTMTYVDQYGNNYVFMSSYSGTMLVQPFEPDKELTNQWGLQDGHGLFIIQELVRAAKAHPAGSFVRYYYHLPGVHAPQEKLAYVVGLPEFECYIGTGMYMQRAIQQQRDILKRVKYGSIWLLIVVLIPVSASILFILSRNRRLLAEIKIREDVEEELKMSETKYRSIFENAVEGIFQSTPEGRFINVNPALARMAGYGSPGEMIDAISSINSQYYADPRDRERYMGALEEKGFVKDYLMRLKRKDGSFVWASNSSRVVRDEEGNVLYYEGTVEDITERKRIEEDAKRLAAIVRHSSEMVNLCALDGRMMFLNEAGLKMLGIEPEKMETINIMQVIPDHLKDLVEKEVIPTLLSGGNWEGDLQYLSLKTGELTDVHALVFTIDDPDTLSHKYWANISLDISHRKRAERALQESEARLRSIATNLPGVVYQFYAKDSGEYGMSYVGQRITEIFGLSIDLESMFPTFLAHVFEEDRERFLVSIEKAVEAGTSWNFEGRFVKPSGEVIWFQGISTPTRHEAHTVFDGILMNITERKKAEERSLQSEEKFTKVFMTAPDCIAITRLADGLIVDVNQGFEEITGWTRGEAIGRTSHDIDFWADLSARDSMVEELKARGEVRDREFLFRRKDGSSRMGVFSARSIQIAGESCLIFVLQDVTDRRRLETEFKHLESQFLQSQKMEAIGTLAGGVAHDFNNILTVLIGCGTLLQLGLDESNPLRMHAEQIISASQKAANLTRSLLAFSRQQSISLAPLDLSEKVRGVEKLLKRLITEDIDLKINVTPVNTVVMADATQIDQIFFNLATNARDAMPKGGTLTIETEIAEMDEQSVRSHGFGEPGRYVLVKVSDTGIGMDKGTAEKIFEPFFTTKETGKGTGLGLATVYGIVKQHNGNITVDSEPGKGAIFRVYLPAVNVEVNTEVAAKPVLRGGNEVILIAEDNSDVRFFMQETLRGYGYTIVEAVDGEDAVNKFLLHGNVDLLVIDSVMPKKNGREAYEEIRKVDPHVKVLFTSGYTKDIVLDKGIEEKEFAFLPKPIWPSTLLRRVREILDE